MVDRGAVSGADVVVDHVAKAFEGGHIAALVDATFRVDRGELVALTGPSGSGKSTLLNLLGALDRSDQGSIVVGGQRLETLDDPAAYRRDIVGFVFQFHNLLPTLSALENVQVPLIGRNGSRERAHALLEEVGLAPRAHAFLL